MIFDTDRIGYAVLAVLALGLHPQAKALTGNPHTNAKSADLTNAGRPPGQTRPGRGCAEPHGSYSRCKAARVGLHTRRFEAAHARQLRAALLSSKTFDRSTEFPISGHAFEVGGGWLSFALRMNLIGVSAAS
jgi:hypothetical protein